MTILVALNRLAIITGIAIVIMFLSRYTTPNFTNVFLHDVAPLATSRNVWHNCSVSLIRNPEEFNTSLDITGAHRMCDSKYFKDHLEQNGGLSCQGSWYVPSNNSDINNAMFQPKGCSFGTLSDNIKMIGSLFDRSHISNILVSGDSNGRMFGQQMVAVLHAVIGQMNGSCDLRRTTNLGTKSQSLLSNESGRNYYNVPGIPNNMLRYEDCVFSNFFCMGWQHECRLNTRSAKDPSGIHNSVSVEYVPMFHILDGTLSLRTNHHEGETRRLFSAETKLEYLLKFYLKHRGYPDVWIYQVPFHHECWALTSEQLKIQLEYVLSLFDLFLPNTTHLVILPDHLLCEPHPSKLFRDRFGATKNAKIHDMNNILINTIQNRVLSKRNYHVMVDAESVSRPLQCKWQTKDGQHMYEFWYKRMATYILHIVNTVYYDTSTG